MPFQLVHEIVAAQYPFIETFRFVILALPLAAFQSFPDQLIPPPPRDLS